MEKSYLTQDSFDNLLRWLNSDRERAGEKYEDIRFGLIQFFKSRGADSAEELADETINRVASKLPQIADNYIGDPTSYFYGVAKKVQLEYFRRQRSVVLPAEISSFEKEEYEVIYSCLERCLAQLPPKHRELLIAYYREGKLHRRKELREKLGVRSGALRVRVYRLKNHLEKCVRMCLEGK